MTATRLVLADRVHTLLPEAPAPACDALLLRDGRVLAVGQSAALRAGAGAVEVVDLRGCTITPGLTDAHIHLLEWALARRELDLGDCRSPEEVAAAVRGAPAPPGPDAWIRGRGWNPHAWGGAYPDRRTLDAVAPDRPVVLQSHDMHALWVNGRGLERAGIDGATRDPEGGRIVRDEAGQPTGVLLDMAAQLVARRLPTPSAAEAEAALRAAQHELHGLGITGVHAFPGVHVLAPEPLAVLQALLERGELRLRVVQHLALDRLEAARQLGLHSGFGNQWLRVGNVKVFLDGALGSRTAWLRQPYVGSEDTGVQVMDAAAFRAAVATAARAGIATAVHAIGDAAVALALDVLSTEGRPGGVAIGLPHRIEHFQLCPPERFADAARAGIVCSMQPAHLITDWAAADRHWGHTRSRGAYAFASLRAHGATLAFGSDAPVEPVDPRLGFYAATERQDLEGAPEGGWYPEERLGMAEVLAAYTVGPALAAGSRHRGRLGAGARADLVAWDRDPLACRGRELLELKCVATLVGGETV